MRVLFVQNLVPETEEVFVLVLDLELELELVFGLVLVHQDMVPDSEMVLVHVVAQ